MRLFLLILALISSVVSLGKDLSVEILRPFENAKLFVSLRCSGNDGVDTQSYCALRKTLDGKVVSETSIRRDRVQQLVSRLFSRLPASEISQEVFPLPSRPFYLMQWRVINGRQVTQGAFKRTATPEEERLHAVIDPLMVRLEGDLDLWLARARISSR